MRQVIIKTKQFCALSREPAWQDWLEKHAPDILDELLRHLSQSRGCKANTEKMSAIYEQLKSRGLQDAVVAFLRKEYPLTVEEIDRTFVRGQKSKIMQAISNKDVFTHYNPKLLSFPQKLVMFNQDREQLLKDVKAFLVPMWHVDYLLIGDFAYIEYFKLKYSKDAEKIKPESREIYKYRISKGISQSEKVVDESPS